MKDRAVATSVFSARGLSSPADSIDDIDLDYAASVADQARVLMARHAIAPTPPNFSVWFQYCLGTWREFNKTIEIIVASKRPFDPVVNRGLYSAYNKTNEQFCSAELSNRLQKVLGDAKDFVSASIDENRAQAKALGSVAARAHSDNDPLGIISILVDELSMAVMRTSALEDRLANSSRELDEIRFSLYQSEQRAQTDALTGLANRHAVENFVRRAQVSAMESGAPLTMLMIDIDNFKQFNDTFGHQTGDHVLRLIALVLKETVRDGDLAARYGGEELIAILPGADIDLSRKIGELIRHAISERPVVRRTTGEVLAKVTVSIGVARFDPGETILSFFERCDRALYLAKMQGRNRTVTELELGSDIAVA